jgi:dynein heavy chain
VFVFLDSFNEYNRLWNDDVVKALKQFSEKEPTLEDYEEKLREFTGIEMTVNNISNYF